MKRHNNLKEHKNGRYCQLQNLAVIQKGKKYGKVKFIQGSELSKIRCSVLYIFVNSKNIETIWQIRFGGQKVELKRLNTGWHETFTETLKQRRLIGSRKCHVH